MIQNSEAIKPKRPAIVALAALWIFLAVLVNLLYGGLLIATSGIVADPPDIRISINNGSAVFDLLDDPMARAAEGTVYVLLGIVQLILGVGFWQLKRWAWVGLMTWQALKLLVDLTNMIGGDRPFFSLVFAIGLVFIVNQTEVRRVFGIRQSPSEAVHANASFRSLDRD